MSLSDVLRGWFRRPAPQIPDELWREGVARLPFLARLDGDDLARLKPLCESFLQRKFIIGAQGLEIGNAIAVQVALQACLPILNLTLDLYRDMPGVIVYPGEFMVTRSEMDEDGVVHEWREPLAGEALDQGGAVVLSWEDVEYADAEDSDYSVVIHEFAHKIDMRDGVTNGCPPLLAAFHQGMRAAEWQAVFTAAYEDFCRRVDHAERQMSRAPLASRHSLPQDDGFDGLPMDPYAASQPAEFFAVASEVFFLAPQRLLAAYPEVYAQLARYYRQQLHLTPTNPHSVA